MQKVIEKKFWDVYHNRHLGALEFYWKNTGKDIEKEEFKSYILEVVEFLKDYKVEAFLTDASKYHLVMSLDIQEWHDKVIMPEFINAGLRIMVFVLNPNDLIESLSLEQSFDEEEAKAMQTHFVESVDEGREIITNFLSIKSSPDTASADI